jgi:hypothetical protein
MSRVGNLRILVKSDPPFRNPPAPEAERIAPRRLQLKPIPWGQRDRDLGRAVCWHICDATPPTVIPFNPRKHAQMKRHLAPFLHT